jgi:SAM-dependent methyltransferase
MNAATAARLTDLNLRFYQTFAGEFSATRRRLQPGVRRVLDRLQGGEVVLDLGCGNGELRRELVRRGHRGPVLGLDFSLPLIQAGAAAPGGPAEGCLQADLTGADWDAAARAILGRPCDLVTAFATLHHIPGERARLRILKKVHSLLAASGRFVHSEWQFLNSPRLRQRLQSWDLAGLAEKDVDPGDYLLDWRSGGRGLRYVHLFNEDELASLAGTSGFRVLESYLSDGENGRLGLYQTWEKA